MAKQIIFIEQQSLKNAVSIMSLKAGVYSCSCGHHSEMKDYYNPKNFYCPKCGGYICKLAKSSTYVNVTPPIDKNYLTEKDIRANRFFLCNASPITTYIEDSYNEEEKTIMFESIFYRIYFDPEDYSTYFKTYVSSFKYYLEQHDIECLVNTKAMDKSKILKKNKDDILEKIDSGIRKFNLPKEILITYFKGDNTLNKKDTIQQTPGFKFLKEAHLLFNGLLDYDYNRYGKIHYTNKYNLNLEGTNLKDITGFPKSVCREALTPNAAHPFFNGIANYEFWSFYIKYLLEKRIDINVIRNIQDMCVKIRESDMKVKKLANPDGRFVHSNEHYIFDMVFELHTVYHYNLNSLLNYFDNIQYKQGIYIEESLTLLKDYNNICRLLGMEKYEKYPPYIKTAHDIIYMRYSFVKNEINDKAIQKISEEHKNLEDHSNNEYEILLPKNAQEIVNEGSRMGHCVASYVNQVISGDTLILFMRNKDASQTGSTIELRENRIVQHKAQFNRRPNKTQIDYIKAWAKKHDFKICC